MNIPKISYSSSFYTSKTTSFKGTTPRGTSAQDPISYEGYNFARNSVNQDTFLRKGGKLHYDSATMAGAPFNGTISNKCNTLNIFSKYYNGKKDTLYIQDNDKGDEVITFQKERTLNRNQGSKDIFWKSINDNYTYNENYDEHGFLCQTQLIKESKNDTGFEIFTTYDEDGRTILEQKIDIGKNIAPHMGYSSRIDYYKNGIKTKAVEFNSILEDKKGGIKTADKRTVFLSSLGGVKRTVEENVNYYDSKEAKTPYAVADETITIYKNGKVKSLDKNFRTIDYTKGIGPLRELVYNEHADTLRETKNDCVVYMDSSKEPYAAEIYEDDDTLPKIICSGDNDTYATVTRKYANVIFMKFFNEDERKIKLAAIQQSGGSYQSSWIEEYDPESGRKVSATSNKGNQKKVRYWSKDGTRINCKELYVDGAPYVKNEYSNKELKRQVVVLPLGGYRVIDFDTKENSAKEYILNNSGEVTSTVLYKDNIATEEVFFNEKGEKIRRQYIDGFAEDDELKVHGKKTLDVIEF